MWVVPYPDRSPSAVSLPIAQWLWVWLLNGSRLLLGELLLVNRLCSSTLPSQPATSDWLTWGTKGCPLFPKVGSIPWCNVCSRALCGVELKLVFSLDHVLAECSSPALICIPYSPSSSGIPSINHLLRNPHPRIPENQAKTVVTKL